jgi:hypothetical protein
VVCNNINLDEAIGDKLDSTELRKEQMKKLCMLRVIQGGSQEHNREQARRRRQEYTNEGREKKMQAEV